MKTGICKDCNHWKKRNDSTNAGNCHKNPATVVKRPDSWCSLWEKEEDTIEELLVIAKEEPKKPVVKRKAPKKKTTRKKRMKKNV